MAVRIGIVGTHFISDQFADTAVAVEGAEIAAVYSRKYETGQSYAQKHGIREDGIYTDYELFLESGIDAVYIASPNYVHCEQALAAMEHKKHVLCEKIMAVNVAEADQMIKCAKENDVVLMEAMRPAFDPAYDTVRQMLPKIGTVRRVTMEYCQYSSRYNKFRQGEVLNAFRPELGNAAIMDIGVYPIYMIVQLFGKAKKVKAVSSKLCNDFEGIGVVDLQYDDMFAEAVYSKITDSVTPSVIMGEEGSILIDAVGAPSRIELCLRNGETTVVECAKEQEAFLQKKGSEAGHMNVVSNMYYEIEQFCKYVETRATGHPHLDETRETIRIIDEARRQNGIVFPSDLRYNGEKGDE